MRGGGAAVQCVALTLPIPPATNFAPQVSPRLSTLLFHVQCHPQMARPVVQIPTGYLRRNALQVPQTGAQTHIWPFIHSSHTD